MTDIERRALLGDRQAQDECSRQWIVLPCPHCKGNGKVSFKDYRFVGRNFRGDKKLVYRIQVICNKCRSRGKPIFTEPLVNPNPYITKWGNNYAETEICKKETEVFLPYVLGAISNWNTRPAPTIGRCVDCSHGIPYKEEHIMCKGRWTDKNYDDFCSDFEPKGGEKDAES